MFGEGDLEAPAKAHHDVMIGGVIADSYRIALAYGITHPAQQHALKKILRAGRGTKTLVTDLTEARDSINRMLEMLREDSTK